MKLFWQNGMVPDMSFKERSKVFRYVNQHRFNSMLPSNLLERRIRSINFGRPSPIHAGTFPENLLSPKSITFKELHFFRVEGKFPEKLLLNNFKVSRLDSQPKEFGTSPENFCQLNSKRLAHANA